MYQTLLGYGEHVQLSVFRCDLTPPRHARLKIVLDGLLHHDEDQLLIVKLGRSTPDIIQGIEVLGRPRRFQLPAPKVI